MYKTKINSLLRKSDAMSMAQVSGFGITTGQDCSGRRCAAFTDSKNKVLIKLSHAATIERKASKA